jgi:hypothetical protein
MGVSGTNSADFQRALKAGKYLAAVSAAHSLPFVSLEDALTLTALAADQAPDRFDRMAVRWINRLTAERKLSLVETRWACERLQDVREGRGGEAVPALRGFISKRASC